MKKYSLPFFLFSAFALITFLSCKKINEATELGGDIIPDNIKTFEKILDARTNNREFNDTTRFSFYDDAAIGNISNDPFFGKTHANGYFDISRPSFGTYPFIVTNKDSVFIDSVVLSLAYSGRYGDTLTPQAFTVSEIDPASNFSDTSFYKFKKTAPSDDFPTTVDFATKSFTLKSLTDSVPVIRPRDTSKVVNVLRFKFSDNNLGLRLKNFDTANAYKSDSAFKKAFRGFAIKAGNSGNGLGFFTFSNPTNTKLIVYYRARIGGKDSSSSTEFYHIPYVPTGALSTNPANFINGQANVIDRNYTGSPAATALNNATPDDDVVYIQSAPGTYATIAIPALSSFQNKVIHRAEIIATRINSSSLDPFHVPLRLMLDHVNQNVDTAFTFPSDLVASADGSLSFALFGGTLGSDNTYHFNITRYIQGIVTRHDVNDSLRIYAPLRTTLFNKSLVTADNLKGTFISVPAIAHIADGRVILAGGNYTANPAMRLRLRIIYSDL